MHIDYTTNIEELKIQSECNGYSNVVRKVLWSITFFDTENPIEVTSVGTIETLLPTDNLGDNGYIEFEDITHQDILDMCLKDAGEAEFLDKLLEGGHAEMLERKLLEVGLVEIDVATISNLSIQ